MKRDYYPHYVMVHSSGMVEKQWGNGQQWTEYPCVYDNGTVGYDWPEKFSKKERDFIRASLNRLRSLKI